MDISHRRFLRTWVHLNVAAVAAWPLRLLAQRSSGNVVIDPHTHIFNAADIPIAGFARKVIPQSLKELGWAGRAVGVLAGMLGKVTQKVAPDYGVENEKLSSWFRDSPITITADWEVRDEQAVSYYAGLIKEYEGLAPVQRKALEEEFHKDGRRGLEELQFAISENDQEANVWNNDLNGVLAGFLRQEAPFLAFLEASRKEETAKLSRNPDAKLRNNDRSLLEGFDWIPGARLVGQIKHFAQFRYQNALELMKLYPEVDAFVAASVDFDFWLGSDKAKTTTWQQIDLLSKISRLTNGKILGMAGFNPWSNLVEPQRLQAIRKGVAKKGIVGVKLYPPMGFQPWDNKMHDGDPGWWSTNAPSGAFGSKLDKQLSELYKFCMNEKLALMAHANDSNGAGPGYGKRADPKYWYEVLKNFADLRFSTGHSGGYEKVITDDDWFKRALSVAGDFPHTYMDFSHFGAIYRRSNRTKLAAALKNHNPVAGKFMYASDWYMLATQKKFKKYLHNFKEVIMQAGLSDHIMGLNAARYLGLSSGYSTRKRLDSFFPGKNTSNKPDWYGKLP